MDILDVLIAKNQSFTAETAKLTQQAQAAVAKANEVANKIDEAQDALDAANEANTRAQEVAATFDSLQQDISTTVDGIVDTKIETAISSITSDVNEAKTAAQEAVTEVDVIDNNTSSAKIKKLRARKKGIQQAYDVMKNYTSTGQNEDGSMTQKAITTAINNLDTKIKNINTSGSGGGGNVSGNISASDAGAIISIDENGNIVPSSITEIDVIITQIVAGTYSNQDVVGLELDYANKSYKRLQGAAGLTAGSDFDKFTMFGGRKRCIVDKTGTIQRFLTDEDDETTVANQNIMVYQPAFYYLRIPMSVTKTDNGFKINKEQIYLADKRYAGFTLHPIFRDAEGNSLRYVLFSAFENCAQRANDDYEKLDTQNIDFNNDCLASIINSKPISGITQEFSLENAGKMASNVGAGWQLTDLAFESMNQMLMMVEYGHPNLQRNFDIGISTFNNITDTALAANTGATLTLGNTSGRASSTTSIRNGVTNTYTASGNCSISYRGMENPYGNTWRMISKTVMINNIITYNNEIIDFKIPNVSSWISNFGYDENHSWVFLPIACDSTANSNLPIGDYMYIGNDSNTNYACIIGGNSVTADKNGIFCYAFDTTFDFHSRHDSARIMFIPQANTTIDNSNYNLWENLN